MQSCIYKIYSSILNNKLSKYLEGEGLFAEEQNGFRKSRSCAQHVFTLTETLQNRINNKKSTHLCFVDFSKAFDFIDRNLMLAKLVSMGMKGKLYQSIKGTYETTLNAIRLNGEVGPWFATENGTKQGDNLSPSLFSVYISDLLDELKASGIGVKFLNAHISVLAYADDLVLVGPTQAGLQQLINITESWCHRNCLCVNEQKTKVMHVRPKGVAKTQYNFTYKGNRLDSVEEYKYLGVIFARSVCTCRIR